MWRRLQSAPPECERAHALVRICNFDLTITYAIWGVLHSNSFPFVRCIYYCICNCICRCICICAHRIILDISLVRMHHKYSYNKIRTHTPRPMKLCLWLILKLCIRGDLHDSNAQCSWMDGLAAAIRFNQNTNTIWLAFWLAQTNST